MIFFIGSETIAVFLFFVLAIAIWAGAAVQHIIPIVMWIVVILDIIIAIKFFVASCSEKRDKGSGPIVSIISSVLALITTCFVFNDLYLSSVDSSVGGIFFFILELIFAGLPWLIVICQWILVNTEDRIDPIELQANFIKEIVAAGILIFVYLV